MSSNTLARPVWRHSVVVKIFAVSFVCIHLPLFGLIFMLGGVPNSENLGLFSVILAATLVGTAVCLISLWRFMSPLRRLATAVETYRLTGASALFNALDKRGDNEIAVMARGVSGLVGEITALSEKLENDASTDPLTGLANRATMFERGEEEMAGALSANKPLSIVTFDLDRFASINGQHGYDFGDKVLVAVGDLVRAGIRSTDIAARVGGDEFMLLLPGATLDEASVFCERLREAFSTLSLEPMKAGGLTASFGVAGATTAMSSVADLLGEIDIALSRAKEAGGNQVRAA